MTNIYLINDLLVVTAYVGCIVKTEVELASTALALRSLLAAILRAVEFSHGSFYRIVSSRSARAAPVDCHHAAHSAGLHFQNGALRHAI